MASGVGKSGSPAPNPITGRPAALSAFALASTASVADSLMPPIRAETRAVTGADGTADMTASSQTHPARQGRGDPAVAGRHGPCRTLHVLEGRYLAALGPR